MTVPAPVCACLLVYIIFLCLVLYNMVLLSKTAERLKQVALRASGFLIRWFDQKGGALWVLYGLTRRVVPYGCSMG